MESHIRIHNNDQIHNLLCGKQPRIGGGPLSKPETHTSKTELTDFSKYPFPDPIEPLNHNSSIGEQGKLERHHGGSSNMIQFNKLRKDGELLGHVGDYLSVYETNYRRKAMLLHQELEEHFLQPVARKLVKKVNGKAYDDYVKMRARAVSAFDKQTHTRDTFLIDLPEIPTISFDTSDLTDPVLKFKKNAEKEKSLTKIIAQQTGEWVEPQQFPERDTMNLKKWKVLAQTRFYKGAEETLSKGKKVFERKYQDSIGTELTHFK